MQASAVGSQVHKEERAVIAGGAEGVVSGGGDAYFPVEAPRVVGVGAGGNVASEVGGRREGDDRDAGGS